MTLVSEWLRFRRDEYFKAADKLDEYGRDLVHDGDYGSPIGERYLRQRVTCHLDLIIDKPSRELRTHYLCAEFCPLRDHDPHAVKESARVGPDRCLVKRMDFGDLPLGGISEPLWLADNRKLDGTLVLHLAVRIPQCELERQIVERDPQILETVPNDQTRALNDRREIRHVIDKQDVLAGNRIELDPEAWTVFLRGERFGDVGVESITEFLGPRDLGPTAIEGRYTA